VVADEPDVVVQDSTNDVGSPDDAVRDAALSLYRRLAVALPDSDVVVVGSLAPPGADPAGVPAVRAALAQAASTAGLSFIDPVGEEWLQPPEGRFADPVHPNDAGYREMADGLMADLQLRGY
jgi:lysophospholipase L1-like esterase